MKNSTSKYKLLLALLLICHASANAQNLNIQKKQLELKQHSLLNRIINATEIKIHAGFGAGYLLSQFDPINPTYNPYMIKDKFSLSISINISKILDNSTYKIKQLELQQLQQEHNLKQKIIQEKITLLKENIKIQSQIIELYEIQFNQNKINADKLLEEKIKLLELQLKLKELELEASN